MKNLKPMYGFQENVFDTLGEKVKELDVNERHDKKIKCYIHVLSNYYYNYLGALLIDEMALSSAVSFNKSTLKVDGLVDLGLLLL